MYAFSSAALFVIICHFRREGKNSLSCLKEFLWCRGWDLNPHELPRSILSRMRLPFRHARLRIVPKRRAGFPQASCDALALCDALPGGAGRDQGVKAPP
mgnify:CR=1 FL=1